MNNSLYDYLEARNNLDEEQWGPKSVRARIRGRINAQKAANAPRRGSKESVWGAKNSPTAKPGPNPAVKKSKRVNTPAQQVKREKALGGDVAKQTKDWKPVDTSAKLSQTKDKANVQSAASKLAGMRKSDPVAAGVAKAPTAAKAAPQSLAQKASGFKEKTKLAIHSSPGLKKGLKVGAAAAGIGAAAMIANKLRKKRKERLAASHDVAYDLQEAAQQMLNLRGARHRNLSA